MIEKLEVGIDEAGMGCLAGDMIVSVMVLPAGVSLPGVRDSKRMTDNQREDLIDSIWGAALWFKTLDASPEKIDQVGLGKVWRVLIRQLAMEVRSAFPKATIILDGNRGVGLDYVTPIVKADDKFLSVSAASVLSKYRQTCYMDIHDRGYPQYGFSSHRGYPTKEHLTALKEYGPCQIHRMSYKPVQEVLRERQQRSSM